MAPFLDFPKFFAMFVRVGCVQPVTDTGTPDGFADILYIQYPQKSLDITTWAKN